MSKHYFWTIVLLIVLGIAIVRLAPSFLSAPAHKSPLQPKWDQELNDDQDAQPAEIGSQYPPSRQWQSPRFVEPPVREPSNADFQDSPPPAPSDSQMSERHPSDDDLPPDDEEGFTDVEELPPED